MRKREKSGPCNLKVWREILTILRVTGEEKDWGISRFGKFYTMI